MEGTNPVPEVEHVDEQLPRTLYTVNFYDVLSLLPRPRQPQSWETQEHSRLPPPVLPRTRPELRRKDFLKQQQRIHALLLQEREGLFRHSYLMGPDAVVAAYSYEDSPFSVREGDCSEEEVANHGMHAAELALIRRRFAEAKASLTDTRGTRPSAVPSTQPRFSCNSEGNFCAQDPPRGTVCAPCVRGSVDDRRAAIFSRRELITREEVYESIRHIADPEHPLTLEQLRVVQPSLVEVTRDAECIAKEENEYPQQHWKLQRGTRVRIVFKPTVPHCSQAAIIGLLLLARAHRAAFAAAASGAAAVEVALVPGSHSSQAAIEKQLHDKERVQAAVSNPSLRRTIADGMEPSEFQINHYDKLNRTTDKVATQPLREI